MNTTTASSESRSFQHDQSAAGDGAPRGAVPKTLVRTRHDRMLAGVASGVAGYVDVDVHLIRIAFAVMAIVGGIGIPLYLACWLLIPDEDTAQSIAAEFTRNVQARHN
jgi:phage shock protein PspC (stress-responsive transcriptional regulator)